jgi:hypothetical protein
VITCGAILDRTVLREAQCSLLPVLLGSCKRCRVSCTCACVCRVSNWGSKDDLTTRVHACVQGCVESRTEALPRRADVVVVFGRERQPEPVEDLFLGRHPQRDPPEPLPPVPLTQPPSKNI